VSRARHVVAAVGGRYSLELGIEVGRGDEEIERWALAATLLGGRITPVVALRAYRSLERAGIGTIRESQDCGREELLALLQECSYAHFDELTASRLHALADAAGRRFGGLVSSAGRCYTDPDDLRGALESLPGWGPVTVRTFLRELRGVWSGARVPLDRRAARAADHLQLPTSLDGLSSLAAASHLDPRDLETALLRLTLCHELERCHGGEECPYAGLGPVGWSADCPR
jgi:endonuclease III